MFTGIVTAIGQITAVAALGADERHGVRLTVDAPAGYLNDVSPGDSIAINGACMTVTTLDVPVGAFTVDVSAESLARTAGLDRPGPVNLEKAMRPQDRLGGHIVSGHVDGVGTVTRLAPVGESWNLRVLAPPALARYLAYKGSITVNGVSLTVNAVEDRTDGCEVSINLIPHTMQHTALGMLGVGARVNLEVDMIARYVERMLSLAAAPTADR
ncbi:riboflavin synthase [Tepidimonas taiwanensis]|jgi:riboflavin synthase|uniref:Riboflavin synthase n=1 Tax=Tepidimonas taiwanensis TaxID=307486 RepID=A0A554WXH6_9BURK|nr:riboflavin synthase [Tepidimonas taiwanensis]MCX7692818.1 riboflavin synthase [Tepidimonas taiwanensis]TSE28274.1 Riboflavin synthase [Tepidimonas taiwanensis]UBQ04629.1 riboflavin synthase [Tepidimonas taiwanensis]